MSKPKTCAWCHEGAVADGAETCDTLCTKLLSLYRRRRPVEPPMLFISDEYPVNHNVQYHGDGYRG